MPTYEYRCHKCENEFEVRQSFADEPLTNCIEASCNGKVSKVFRGVGISFKGDGFYKNDHGSSSRQTSDTTAEAKSANKEPSSLNTSESRSDAPESSKETLKKPKTSDSKSSD